MFRNNVGGLDRGVRVAAGLGMIALAFIGPETPWGWLGLVPLVTGLMGFCPLYSLIGVNTCPKR